MATVHFGRLLGPVGFARTVAIKRLYPQFAKDADFAAMFLDEARVAARVQHPNVVQTLDVVALEDELFLVMEYVDGESLARLLRAMQERKEAIDPRIVVAILSGALHGLHAAHEAKSERGEPLHIVHRDVSPQNILVGRDGNARVLDFGVAKAVGRLHSTREGAIKGKVAYMAPEQIRSTPVDRRADVYAAGVVLWEALTVHKLFRRDNDAATLEQALFAEIAPPSTLAKNIPPELDALVLKALDRDPAARFQSAREMALALERTIQPELASNVGDWVRMVAADALEARAGRVAEIESASDISAQVSARADEVTQAADVSGALAAVSGKHAAVDDPSLVSAAVSRGSPPLRKRSGLIVVVVAVLAAALGSVVWLAAQKGVTPAVATAVPTATQSVAIQAPTASAPPVAAVVSANAEPTTSATAAAASTVKPRPHAAKPIEDCKVPYTVDSAGTTIYKRECL